MLQDCVDMMNTMAPYKMERVISEGGCQELQRAHDWKSVKAVEIKVSTLGTK